METIQEHSLFPMRAQEFKAFRALIHRYTGIWLRDGKEVMLASRLSRRLRHHGLTSFTEYLERVQREEPESDEFLQLINCVTTNKTSFFREKHHFEFLASLAGTEFSASLDGRNHRSFRVWSAACSTGEEAYSIAITLLEAFEQAHSAGSSGKVLSEKMSVRAPGLSFARPVPPIEVVASDIDTKVLETAARSIYGEESLTTVPQALWKKYFLRGTKDMCGKVRMKPAASNVVRFQRTNLQDPSWNLDGLFNAIFFRNALIYFNHETQDLFLRRMIRYLKPRGYLFLGNAEHIPWLHDLLEPLNQTMYRLR